MTIALKKTLDNTPKSVYTIRIKDGEGFDLSPIPNSASRKTIEEAYGQTLYDAYTLIRNTYNDNPDLLLHPPVFAGGFLRDILWAKWPKDLDLFVNSHGLEKEEAEDNLCLFLSKLGLGFQELGATKYKDNMNCFRVFDLDPVNNAMCNLQVILKDMGPPQEDPLYVTEDFHYNHGKAVLPVVGEPEITYHGHAMAGWLHKIHAQYREGGFNKCRSVSEHMPFQDIYNFKQVDFTKPTPSTVLEAIKEKHNEQLKVFQSGYNQSAMSLRYI